MPQLNSSGSSGPTWQNNLKAYDRLPRSVRKALQDANQDWACTSLLAEFNRGEISAPDLIARVKRWDAMDMSAKTMARRWGPKHPQAIAGTQRDIARRARK